MASREKIVIFLFNTCFILFLQCISPASAFLSQIAARLPLPGNPSPPGSPWPLPQSWEYNDRLATLGLRSNFQYSLNIYDCDILNVAIERYNYDFLTQKTASVTPASGLPILSSVNIQISNESAVNLCGTYPKLDTDSKNYESYEISVGETSTGGMAGANITATTVWGALRGLETFSQLIWRDRDWKENHYYINFTRVSDWPRYPHRGLMLDTARHYLSPKVIEEVLDAMSYNKLNVFHWHIVDDQSFPFVSTTFPELSNQAYIPGLLIYDPPNVQRIIERARLRGIRVILEFDTPGHTLALGKAFPELLTPCYGDGVNPGTPDYPNHAPYEILDPTRENTYTFMKKFFSEVFYNVTKDEFLHLGMDEVYYSCWKSSPEIKAFMDANNYTEYNQVQEHYSKRHIEMVKSLGAKAIIFQDPLDYDVQLDKEDLIVQVWKSGENNSTWQTYFQKVLDAGFSTILSSCWYINYISYGQTWRNYYECDPELSLPNPISDNQKKLILGGEAAIWAEYADATNVVARLFPFVGAVAEKLWSAPNSSTTDDAMWRLDEHRCRILGRGIHSQPIFNGYCFPQELEYIYNP